MKFLRSIWCVLWNIVTLGMFFGMLSVANEPIDTVIVSGIGLVYTTIIAYAAIIIRTQLAVAYTSTNQFIFLAKMDKDSEKHQEILDLEEDTKEQWSDYQSKNSVYYINMAFTVVIWSVAVFSIIKAINA